MVGKNSSWTVTHYLITFSLKLVRATFFFPRFLTTLMTTLPGA
jgi:hypothetical protein